MKKWEEEFDEKLENEFTYSEGGEDFYYENIMDEDCKIKLKTFISQLLEKERKKTIEFCVKERDKAEEKRDDAKMQWSGEDVSYFDGYYIAMNTVIKELEK